MVEKQPLPPLNETDLGGETGEILLAPGPALRLRLEPPSHAVQGGVGAGAGPAGTDFYRKYFRIRKNISVDKPEQQFDWSVEEKMNLSDSESSVEQSYSVVSDISSFFTVETSVSEGFPSPSCLASASS